MTNEYERATAIWLSRKYSDSLKPELIDRVEFTTIDEGYCETCAYTTMGITFRYRKTDKSKSGSFYEYVMNYDSPADFVREVCEILAEMKEENAV